MKPLNLKIKGINSFIEQQEIDFRRLTENKFFGIFGPTGSGKSTILDGITLALYGQVARKSDNYINANVTSANVSYEFQISGAVKKRYRVEREFKLDKNLKTPRGGKCKIVGVKENGEEVLAEGVKSVNAKCMEIIGLSCDDFTRTVVLPQGKFSEFLTLKGAERNHMLERLFNLEQYGEQLTVKLKGRVGDEECKNSILQGQLDAYGEVNEEDCKAKELELEDVIEEKKSATDECEKAKQAYDESKEVWKLQEEFEGHALRAKEIEKQKPDIDEEKKLVDTSKKAAGIKPFVDEWEKEKESLEKVKEELEECEKDFKTKEEEKSRSEAKYKEIQINKDEELPTLQKQEEKAKEALKKSIDVEEIEKDIQEKSKDKKKLEKEISDDESKLTTLSELLNGKKISLEDQEKEKVELRVDAESKSRVQKGLIAEKEFINAKEQQKSLENKVKEKKEEIEHLIADREIIEKSRDAKKEDLDKGIGTLNQLKENPPMSMENLQAMHEKKVEFTNAWKAYKQYGREKEESGDAIKALDKSLEKEREKEKILNEELESLEADRRASEMEHLAVRLREDLADGDVCPVCGSLEHYPEHIKIVEKVVEKDFAKLIATKKKELASLSKSIHALEVNYDINKRIINEKKQQIDKLGQEFLQVDIQKLDEEYAQKKGDYDNYHNQQMPKAEEVVKKLTAQFNKLVNNFIETDTKLKANKEDLKQKTDDLSEVETKSRAAKDKYDEIKKDSSVESFEITWEEITNKEKKLEKLEGVTKKLTEEIKYLEEKEKAINKDLTENRKNHAVLKSELTHLDERTKEIWKDIKEKVGGETDISGYKEKLSQAIKKLEDDFQTTKEQKKKAEDEFTKVQSIYERLKGQKSEATKNLEKRKSVMEQKIKESDFHSPKEVDESIISDEAMAIKNQQIDDFEKKSAENEFHIKELQRKLDGRSISDEQWQKTKEELEQIQARQEELNTRKIELTNEIKCLKENLQKVNEISKKKKKIEHTISMLHELEKLFKGKRFVQFVAAEKLKYVSLEASKTLMEISGGSYELTTTTTGEFIIKDYKNGGIERETSTLSGGELFLASLSLALALSTQIQLTNDAPLELFFLDEGFGTLDDNLLEEVISALERLQNAKRAIGLISHVTEIKNRVPIKLMVTPAEMGKQGSRVNIELS